MYTRDNGFHILNFLTDCCKDISAIVLIPPFIGEQVWTTNKMSSLNS